MIAAGFVAAFVESVFFTSDHFFLHGLAHPAACVDLDLRSNLARLDGGRLSGKRFVSAQRKASERLCKGGRDRHVHAVMAVYLLLECCRELRMKEQML